jgi:hypothetical protein
MNPFLVTDCALIVMATGEKAVNIREMTDRIRRMDDPGIMYFHFWDCLLRPAFIDPEYQNDFASWVYHQLHDRRLAERLAILNPGVFSTMDQLRHKLIEIIEDRMDEPGFDQHIESDSPFFFMRSQIIVFDTQVRLESPETMGAYIRDMALGSVFYHFIDARRRTDSGKNDFTEWLWGWGDPYTTLAGELSEIDPYFKSLLEIREQLATVFARHLKEDVSHG